MTLTQAIEKVEKMRVLTGIVDGEKSDRAKALDIMLEIARVHEQKGEVF